MLNASRWIILSGRSCGTTRSLMAAACLAALPLRTISPWQVRRHDALPDRPGSDGETIRRGAAPGTAAPAIPRPPDVGRGFFCYCGRNPSDTSFIPRRSTAPGDAASFSTAVMKSSRQAGGRTRSVVVASGCASDLDPGWVAPAPVAAHVMRVTETAHWLEWQDWADPILQKPYEIKEGLLHIPDLPGVGLDWNEDAVTANHADL